MNTKHPSSSLASTDHDAPDLSRPPWPDKFAKARLAPTPGENAAPERGPGGDLPLENDAPIHSAEEYALALRQIEHYFRHELDLDSPEGREFDKLAERIRAYEERHWPIAGK